jgi:hypothetical protein
MIELPGINKARTGEAYHSPGRRGARRKENPLHQLLVKRGRVLRDSMRTYTGFLITAHAILAGELEEPGVETA